MGTQDNYYITIKLFNKTKLSVINHELNFRNHRQMQQPFYLTGNNKLERILLTTNNNEKV